MADRSNKYMWTSKELDDWVKKQSRELNDLGIRVSTAGITRIIVNRVLVPNKIKLPDLIVPQVKINKKKWRKNDFVR